MGILGDSVTNQSWKPTLIPQQQHRSVDYSETGCVEVKGQRWVVWAAETGGKAPCPTFPDPACHSPTCSSSQLSSALTWPAMVTNSIALAQCCPPHGLLFPKVIMQQSSEVPFCSSLTVQIHRPPFPVSIPVNQQVKALLRDPGEHSYIVSVCVTPDQENEQLLFSFC